MQANLPKWSPLLSSHLYYKEFEGTKGVIRIRKSKKTMAKRKSTKRLTTIYKTYT